MDSKFCEFCGKGPFPQTSALKKHVRLSVDCNKAARQQWASYAANIWDNAPGPSNVEPQPPAFQQSLDKDEFPNMPDTTIDEDLQGFEGDFVNNRGPQLEPNPIAQLAEPVVLEVNSNVEGAEGDDEESANYIEGFPANLGAGAAWGEEDPFFEKLRREQDENGSSRWGPFEDEDEWELAQWLIKNNGQNQIDAFLNMNIVSTHLRL